MSLSWACFHMFLFLFCLKKFSSLFIIITFFVLHLLGELVPGLDHAIGTMRKGERALFTIPPELGYGAAFNDCVPPNSFTEFEVELVSWITVVDICKDGGIIKKILEKGEQMGPPGELDEVRGNSSFMHGLLCAAFVVFFVEEWCAICSFFFQWSILQFLMMKLSLQKRPKREWSFMLKMVICNTLIWSWSSLFDLVITWNPSKVPIRQQNKTPSWRNDRKHNEFAFLGHLCPALPRAIKTMKRGEKVKLIVQPQCRSSFTFSLSFLFFSRDWCYVALLQAFVKF